MTRDEHLLTIATEEAIEVAQRCTKALRFGLTEVQPGQPFDNTERIRREFAHLLAALEMLKIPPPGGKLIDEKVQQVERFLEYSKECGTLQE